MSGPSSDTTADDGTYGTYGTYTYQRSKDSHDDVPDNQHEFYGPSGDQKYDVGDYAVDLESPVTPMDIAPLLIRDDLERFKYGWGSYIPECMQNACLQPKMFLVFLSAIAFLNGFGLHGTMEAASTQIQRKFTISNEETIYIMLTYYVGYIVSIFPITYFGSHGAHKPRWIASGAVLVAIGSLIMMVPHFVLPGTDEHDQFKPHCGGGGHGPHEPYCRENADRNKFKHIFGLGYFIHGLGSATPFTMGVAFMDEHVSYQASPVYTGLFRAFHMLGPVCGYLVAGFLANVPSDLSSIDSSRPVDYGAWWVAMLLCSICSLIMAFFMYGFPSELVGKNQAHMRHMMEEVMDKWRIPAYASKQWTRDMGEGVWDFIKRAAILIVQPTFAALVIERILTMFLVGGFSSFISEYIEKVFRVSSSLASYLTGAVVVVGAVCGLLSGTFVQYKFTFQIKHNLRWSLFSAVASLVTIFGFMIKCNPQQFVGVNYKLTASDPLNFSQPCNHHCHCDHTYRPVCSDSGKDSLQFYSPCHAGCWSISEKGGSNCSCLLDHLNDTLGIVNEADCVPRCPKKMIAFLLAMGWCSFFFYLRRNSMEQAVLRFVPFKYRLVGLSFMTGMASSFGAMPSVHVFSTLLEKSCIMHELQVCDFKKQCLLYSNDLPISMTISGAVIAGVIVLVSFAALATYSEMSEAEPTVVGTEPKTRTKRRKRRSSDD